MRLIDADELIKRMNERFKELSSDNPYDPYVEGFGEALCVFVNEAKTISSKDMWISVDERLPEIKDFYLSDVVLGYLANGRIALTALEEVMLVGCIFRFGGYYDYARETPEAYFTHWMPLPEPPDVEKGDLQNDNSADDKN